jgi:hypothetical protein
MRRITSPVNTFLDMPYTATLTTSSVQRNITRLDYANAVYRLTQQGLKPRDIGEALHLGTAAVIALLESPHAP